MWPLLKLIESFYVHTAPLRLGLVFAVNNTASGLEDAGVALLNTYNYIAEVKDPYQGLSFITDVSYKIISTTANKTKKLYEYEIKFIYLTFASTYFSPVLLKLLHRVGQK